MGPSIDAAGYGAEQSWTALGALIAVCFVPAVVMISRTRRRATQAGES
jgi:uncharacterized membrane protein